MTGLKRLGAVYLIGVAVAVAVWFSINILFLDNLDVSDVWFVLDILMAVGLVVGLAYNFDRKRRMDSQYSGDGITRRYLEANVALYLTAGITILFLHNWIAFLKVGLESNNHQAWVIWAVVDTLLPLVLGATGCAMWRDAAES